jgi:flagellar hook-basal body complex protein FliE
MNPISNLPPIVDSAGYLVDRQQNALGSAATAPVDGSVASSGSFAQSLVNAVGSLSGLQANADTATTGLALNQGTDIHQAMIAMEQASLGMHLAVQVRDKAVEAYQSLANMQM